MGDEKIIKIHHSSLITYRKAARNSECLAPRIIVECLSILALLLLLASCGLKGPPRLPANESPQAPVDIKVLQRYHPRQVVLNWDYPDKHRDFVKRFVVKRSNGGDHDRNTLVNGTTFTDSDLDADVIYTYSIYAVSIGGIHGDVSEPVEVRPVTALTKPVDLTFDIGNESVTLDWKYPESGFKFNIYRDAALTPVNPEPVGENFLDVTPILDTVVRYTIRAVKETDILTEGPPAEEIVIGPENYVPSSPSGLGFALTDSKVLVFWNDNPETWIRGYRVYRSPSEDGDFIPVGMSETPAFEDTDNASGKRFYRVRALGPLKEGPLSETIAVEMKR
jgi:predicted small lipoprotein YifL